MIWLFKFMAFTALVYMGYGAILVYAHRAIIYPFFADDHPVEGLTRMTVPGPDGARVSVADGGGPVVLFFMGNAGNLAYFVPWLDLHARAGRTLVAMEYPGGAGLPGKPTEAGLKASALRVYDWAAETWPGRPILVHGYSLGSGLAMHVAARRNVAALLLEAPYGSVCRIMTRRSWLPACLMPFVDRWQSVADVAAVSAPVLILHGDADRVIPLVDGRRLAEAFPAGTVRMIVLPGGQHADLPDFPAYREAVAWFLDGVQAP